MTGQADSAFLTQVNSMYCSLNSTSFNHSFIPPSIHVIHACMHSLVHSFIRSFICSFNRSLMCLRKMHAATFSLHSLHANTQAFDRQPLLRIGRGSGMVSMDVPTMQLLHCPSPCSLLPNRRARSSAVCAESSNAKHTSRSRRLPKST